MEQFVLLDGRKYKVQTDENGIPVKISRYNEQYKMYVSLKFTKEENQGCEQAVLSLLKNSYIRRVTGILSA